MDKRYQVFISSTYSDLREERSKVMQTVMSLDCIPSGMELFGTPANVPVNVPVDVPVNLSETQKRVFSLIKGIPQITHYELANRLSVTEKTAKRATKVLREFGIIAREGSDKTGEMDNSEMIESSILKYQREGIKVS